MLQLPVPPSASVENIISPPSYANSREEKAARLAVRNYTTPAFGGKK
jgi:hypothetical protein